MRKKRRQDDPNRRGTALADVAIGAKLIRKLHRYRHGFLRVRILQKLQLQRFTFEARGLVDDDTTVAFGEIDVPLPDGLVAFIAVGDVALKV